MEEIKDLKKFKNTLKLMDDVNDLKKIKNKLQLMKDVKEGKVTRWEVNHFKKFVKAIAVESHSMIYRKKVYKRRKL